MRKRFIILGSLALSLTFLNSCEKDNDETGTTTTEPTTSASTSSSTSSSTTSTSGSIIGTTGVACTPTSSEVVIGAQTWINTNLNVEQFRNGDLIPEAKTEAEWEAASVAQTPAWCYYLNSLDSGAKYGKLYNWYAVNDSRGLAPTGWHIPSDNEWKILTDYLEGVNVAGTKMKNTCGWWFDYFGQPINGNNSSGFSALPSGMRYSAGTFDGIGGTCHWWSSTTGTSSFSAWSVSLNSISAQVYIDYNSIGRGYAVRCIKD